MLREVNSPAYSPERKVRSLKRGRTCAAPLALAALNGISHAYSMLLTAEVRTYHLAGTADTYLLVVLAVDGHQWVEFFPNVINLVV